MEENKKKILREYTDYRNANDVKDEVIDNIFLNEMTWPDGDGNECHLFKDCESIKKFFDNMTDFGRHADDNPIRIWGGEGPVCGTMYRNACICDNINEAIYNRIYEELEKRNFEIIREDNGL
jgi:hypothetical protein